MHVEEVMDPAVLAIGKGRLLSGLAHPAVLRRCWALLPSVQFNGFENEARHDSQGAEVSFTQQQHRICSAGDVYSSPGDSCRFSPRTFSMSTGGKNYAGGMELIRE